MSDELNVWRDADGAFGPGNPGRREQAAAAVIRDYGDRRDATARSEGHAKGYQQAIADVVEWLESVATPYPEGAAYSQAASEITRRFGKDA